MERIFNYVYLFVNILWMYFVMVIGISEALVSLNVGLELFIFQHGAQHQVSMCNVKTIYSEFLLYCFYVFYFQLCVSRVRALVLLYSVPM